ncbi:BamA/TamA family outer membrane protein [Porphyromonas pogonae]|uniref:translocation and assembly module lipoprotein TamL n=1 Tax=Porphyromonas pogonae TaxID=867595 RepID=UPI002E7890F2|nr:BamA/TamA family outer membrane protein [Porphyromonas pogonae]
MRRKNKHILLTRVLAALFAGGIAAGCSVTQNLPEGQQLYIGVKKIKIEDEDRSAHGQKAIASAEKPLLVPPNNALFGSAKMRSPLPPIGLLIYNKYVNDSTRLGKWIFKRFGSKPIFISDINPPTRSIVATNILHEYGYLNAEIRDSVITMRKDSLQAKVSYFIKMNKPYTYDSIEYLPPIRLANGDTLNHKEISVLKKGGYFMLDDMITDRKEITHILRDNGYYYFRAKDVAFEADTLITPNKVHLRTLFAPNLPAQAKKPWKIGNINVQIWSEKDLKENLKLKDSTVLDNKITVYHNGKLPFRKKVLQHRIRLNSNDFYSQTNQENTLMSLTNLGTLAGTEFLFRPRNPKEIEERSEDKKEKKAGGETNIEEMKADTIPGILDLTMILRKDRPLDLSLEALFKFKSNNYIGPGANVGISRSNVFGGGEVLALNLYGSYEWLTGQSSSNEKSFNVNSYQLGADLGLTFPALLFPKFTDKYYPYPTSTTFKISASTLNRARFFSMNSFGLSIAYDFKPNGLVNHRIVPLSLAYNKLGHQTERFRELMAQNPALMLSFRSQFIPQMAYYFTFDNYLNGNANQHLWLRCSFSQAGNLLNLGYLAAGKKYNDTKKLFGVPFAQFVKGTAEVRYTHRMDRNQSLAFRFGTGAIYSYGNMKSAPYNELFYVGGANSIRAFTVRSLGPGKYIPTGKSRYSYIDQVGDFKLETNIEYRIKLVGALEAAAFLDAGNVWLLRKDEQRPGGALSEIKGAKDFFKQIALGTGAGLRYDLSYLVIRFDAGIGLHLPYETSRKGFYNIPKFKDGLGLHLAVGYPF